MPQDPQNDRKPLAGPIFVDLGLHAAGAAFGIFLAHATMFY